MKVLRLTYTPQESYQLLKDVYKTNIHQEIKDHIRIISGCAKTQNTTLEHAYKICLKLQSKVAESIRFAAAYHFLTQLSKIEKRINQLKDEQLQLTAQSGLLEIDKEVSNQIRGYRRTAIYKRAEEISLEIKQLQYAKTNLSNIEVTAQIIEPHQPRQKTQNGTV